MQIGCLGLIGGSIVFDLSHSALVTCMFCSFGPTTQRQGCGCCNSHSGNQPLVLYRLACPGHAGPSRVRDLAFCCEGLSERGGV